MREQSAIRNQQSAIGTVAAATHDERRLRAAAMRFAVTVIRRRELFGNRPAAMLDAVQDLIALAAARPLAEVVEAVGRLPAAVGTPAELERDSLPCAAALQNLLSAYNDLARNPHVSAATGE